jgi:hypothetical protein
LNLHVPGDRPRPLHLGPVNARSEENLAPVTVPEESPASVIPKMNITVFVMMTAA